MFSKISENSYRLLESEELINKSEEIIKDISGGHKYNEPGNLSLQYIILSRLVSSLFIKNYPDKFKNFEINTIELIVKNKSVTISVGEVVSENKSTSFLDGVLEI